MCRVLLFSASWLRLSASPSASWSLDRPPLTCISGHESTVWPIVCHWPQSQSSYASGPHLCKLRAMVCPEAVQQCPRFSHANHGHCILNRFRTDSIRSQVVGRRGRKDADWPQKRPDNQSSFHCVVMSMSAASVQMGRQDVSRCWR